MLPHKQLHSILSAESRSRLHPLFLLLFATFFVACGNQASLPPQAGGQIARSTATRTPASIATATASPEPFTPETSSPTLAPTPTPVPTDAPPTALPTPLPTMAPALPGTSQGFELVGHTSLGSIGWHAGLALKDHCAYIGNRRSEAISIVDVSDPAHPTPLPALELPGGQAVEVRALPQRNLLLVADFANASFLTFDVSDCENPQPIGVFELPGTLHEFFVWDDGQRVLAFLAMFDHAPPDLLVVDVTDPANPEEVARWATLEESHSSVGGILHSLTVSPDGTRGYLALWNGGYLTADLNLPHISMAQSEDGSINAASFPAAHTAVTLDDPRYVLLTAELYRCPFGAVAIVDVADPGRPQFISELALPENRCEDLPQADAVFTAHNPLIVGDLVFLSWYGAGLQVLDVQNPYQPQRVAQFVPSAEDAAPFSYVGSYPVQTWSYPILHDGLLYVADIQSGLYVLRYEGPYADTLMEFTHLEGNIYNAP